MNDLDRYYQTLGLAPTASAEEIKQAYRRLAKAWHPDRFISDPILLEQAESEIKKINQAYAAIKDNSSSKIQTDRAKTSHQKNTPEYHYAQGVILAEADKFSEAITEFSLAIRLQPNYLEAYQYRGFVLSKLGYEHRANSDMQKAARLKLVNKVNERIDSTFRKAENETKRNKEIRKNSLLRTLIAHNKAVCCVAISPDNKFFATGGKDKIINLWELSSMKNIGTLQGHKNSINCLAWVDNNRILISGGRDKKIKFWDLALRKNILTFGSREKGHSASINSLIIDRDRNSLISSAEDNLIKIWDLAQSRLINTITGSATTLTSLAITQDGQFFCSAGLEKQLRIRNAENGKLIRSLRGNAGVLAVAFSPDGNLLATGGCDCNIQVWDIISGQKIYTLTGHIDRVSSVTFSHDGKFLISGSWDAKLKLWRLNTGKEINTLTGHSDRILSVAIASDNRTIISSSADCSIKIWQANVP